jgi:hypothetical protein
MKLAFIGPDMTGKSNIAQELGKRFNTPVFKNAGEWKTELNSEDYFLNLLRFGGPFLMDFIRQTNVSVILDRFYPCELVYAEAFNRATDMNAIAWMDQQFADAGGKFIICLRKDYNGLVDDVYPDALPQEVLEELDTLYQRFYDFTACECLVLYTDSQDLDDQINKITNFLGDNYYELS